MNLSLITPAEVRRMEVSKVFFPGVDGSFEVLRGHAPLLAALGNGQIRWETAGGGSESFDIKGGFVQVSDDNLEAVVE